MVNPLWQDTGSPEERRRRLAEVDAALAGIREDARRRNPNAVEGRPAYELQAEEEARQRAARQLAVGDAMFGHRRGWVDAKPLTVPSGTNAVEALTAMAPTEAA